MRLQLILLITLLLLPLSHTATVKVIKPAEKEMEGGEIELGLVGPGQTIELEVDRNVYSGGKFGKGGQWDILRVLSVPDGWSSEDSRIYEQPMKAKIKVARGARDATYRIALVAVDENNYDELGNVSFFANVTVSKDVLSTVLDKNMIETGSSQPASYCMDIENRGAASDVFEISCFGVPSWNYAKKVFVPFMSKRKVCYDVVANEEKVYTATLSIVSLSSPLIRNDHNITTVVKSDVLGDYRACANGLLIFPLMEQPIYSLMGLLSNFFGG